MAALRRIKKNPSFVSGVFLHPATPVIAILLLASILLTGFYQARVFFPVHHVTVRGAYHINRERLQESLLPMMSGGFFSLNPVAIRNAVLKMPWVADAEVTRVWPDRLSVIIAERKAVARWNRAGVVSSAGIVFTPDAITIPAGLPEFSGPEGAQRELLGYYSALVTPLGKIGVQIAALEFLPTHSLMLHLSNGVMVRVGSRDILTRINHFVKVYPQVVGNRSSRVDYVDLRYADGFAVRWKKVA